MARRRWCNRAARGPSDRRAAAGRAAPRSGGQTTHDTGSASAGLRDAGARPPNAVEQWVQLAVIRQGERACQQTVEEDIEARTGARLRKGAVASTLATLARSGRLEQAGPPEHPLGLRRVRAFYRVTVHGRRALRLALRATDAMRSGLPGLTAPG